MFVGIANKYERTYIVYVKIRIIIQTLEAMLMKRARLDC